MKKEFMFLKLLEIAAKTDTDENLLLHADLSVSSIADALSSDGTGHKPMLQCIYYNTPLRLKPDRRPPTKDRLEMLLYLSCGPNPVISSGIEVKNLYRLAKGDLSDFGDAILCGKDVIHHGAGIDRNHELYFCEKPDQYKIDKDFVNAAEKAYKLLKLIENGNPCIHAKITASCFIRLVFGDLAHIGDGLIDGKTVVYEGFCKANQSRFMAAAEQYSFEPEKKPLGSYMTIGNLASLASGRSDLGSVTIDEMHSALNHILVNSVEGATLANLYTGAAVDVKIVDDVVGSIAKHVNGLRESILSADDLTPLRMMTADTPTFELPDISPLKHYDHLVICP